LILKGNKMTHVLYNPGKLDLVRDKKGAPVTCERLGDVTTPPGHYWLLVHDDIDGTGPHGSQLGPANKLGAPQIVLRGMHAVRLFPIVRK
jgi:hypothetical protein